jgi:hypothetical protein
MYRKLLKKRSAIVAAAALAAGLIAPVVSTTASAYANSASPSANAKPPPGTTNLCNYYYEWIGKVRFPLQPDPHAVYTYVIPSNQAGLDGIGFLVQGDFVHAAWTSWMTYTGAVQPFSVANFVNNPPANTNVPILPNAGSVDPFTDGQPMLGTPRKFTLLFTPNGYTGRVASTLAGVAKANIPEENFKTYPTIGHGNSGNFWILANRNYVAFPGYNPGGTTKDTFPITTAVDLATGKPVNCQKYSQIPDRLQGPPTNPPSELNYGRVPTRITLKNGSFFSGVDNASDRPAAQFAPANPKGLVVFTRPPRLPGGDVATIPPPDNCSGYLGTTLDPTAISLIRIPHVANYTNTLNVTSSTAYPNPVHPSQPWQASYESVVQYGASATLYQPGSPNTNSLADAEFKADRTGGSTFVVWPRILSPAARARLIAYAARQGWPLIRGGTRGPLTGANMIMRVKAPASNYYGSTSKVPCYYGTTTSPQHDGVPWRDVPIGTRDHPNQYVATAANMGQQTSNGVVSAAPQGVTCRTVGNLTSGKCLAALKKYIKTTGGSYFAP